MATNEHQQAIAEINRARKTTKTMVRRLMKQDKVLCKSARLLRKSGVRPYRKKGEKEMTISH